MPELPVSLILGPAIIGALAALGGAGLTNYFAEQRHKREMAERRREKADQRRLDEDRRQTDRELAALDYAEHLETYALHCANVSSFNAQFSHQNQKYMELATLPDWPRRIEWKLLGLKRAAWARNFHAQTRLARLTLSDAWDYNGPDGQADDEAEQAVKIGVIAWEEAVAVRSAHGLPPITHLPGTWDFTETLARDAKGLQERAVAREAAAEF